MKAAIITIWRRNGKKLFEPDHTWTVSAFTRHKQPFVSCSQSHLNKSHGSMIKVCGFFLVFSLSGFCVAQESDATRPAIKARSNLVMVPVFVSTNYGQPVFALSANDFVLTDNGNPQHATLELDTDSQPLALAIVVEAGGAGATHVDDYKQLDFR